MSELFHPQPRDRALDALVALARHARAAVDLPAFSGLLTETVAELMDAEGALLGRLDGRGSLRGQPHAHALPDDLVAGLEAPCHPEGTGFAERIVYGGEVFRAASGDDPGFAPYRPVLEALGLREGLAVPWRSGDTPLGLLLVYNPRGGGFTAADVPVLLVAAHVAGLVWEGRRDAATADLQSAIAARDTAEAASRAKSEYLSRMSHELRTPLTAIIGFADLLLMEERRGRSRDGLQSILRAGEHLLAIVNEILDIARIESGQLSLEVEPVELRPLAEECCRLMAVAAEDRRISLRAELGAAAPLWVMAEAQRLHQVLLNLISNAIKYNRDGGSVTVAASPAGEGRLRLTVLDTGGGITPDRLGLLFQPFQRLDAERSGVQGSGLGLALSRQIVEAMGGRIGVESAPGRGSTFWVELPAAAAPAEAAGEGEPARPAEPRQAVPIERTVLHIEDDPATSRVVEQAFEHRPNVRLITAMEGRLGLRLAREQHPDLILLDLHLPDIDGLALLHRLRAQSRTRGIPVAVVSADATDHDRDRVLDAGALAHLVKPVRIQALLEFVDSALDLNGAARAGPGQAGVRGHPASAGPGPGAS